MIEAGPFLLNLKQLQHHFKDPGDFGEPHASVTGIESPELGVRAGDGVRPPNPFGNKANAKGTKHD